MDLGEARETPRTAAVPGTRGFFSLPWEWAHLSMWADRSVRSGESEPGFVLAVRAEEPEHRRGRNVFNQFYNFVLHNIRTHHLSVMCLTEAVQCGKNSMYDFRVTLTLGLHPSFIAYWLCDTDEVVLSFWASCFSSVKQRWFWEDLWRGGYKALGTDLEHSRCLVNASFSLSCLLLCVS